MSTFYADFYGNSIFNIFFNDFNVLEIILKQLDYYGVYNETAQVDKDDKNKVNQIEEELGRIYKKLSIHE